MSRFLWFTVYIIYIFVHHTNVGLGLVFVSIIYIRKLSLRCS